MAEPAIPARFDVLEVLSRTDGEILLRARDRLLQREVVLRRAAPELVHTWRDREVKDGALRSARAMARVQHPNVVRLLDVLETEEGPLVVLEPVPGESLAARLARDGRMPADEVLRLARDLAGALEAVHAQGVVHRGVSATSVTLRPDGSACLGGFVFAKASAALESAVGGSTFVYSGRAEASEGPSALPPHPAPEMVAGGVADARCDLFALGWVLYTALTGAAPYPRDLEVERWREPADPRAVVPDTDRSLTRAIQRLLRTSPLQRFPSASELRAALTQTPGAAVAAPARARWRLPVVAAAAFVLVAGVAAVLALRDRTGSAGRGVAPPPPADQGASAYSDRFTSARALLVGISDYSGTGWPSLANARRDVEALAARLNELAPWDGWQVRTLSDGQATKQAIKDALAQLAEETQDPDSRVFLYFAGHGVRDELSPEHGFVVPADARPRDQDLGRDSYLLYQEGFDLFFARTKAKHVLLALDCCYGGGISSLRGAGDVPRDKLLRRKAHIVLSSSQQDEAASDGLQGAHSPFAQAFLDALGDPRADAVTSADLSAAITRAFSRFEHQTPRMGYHGPDGGDGQFVFFLKPPK